MPKIYLRGCGGLGNILFQLAAAVYYCENFDYNLELITNDTLLFGTSNLFKKTKCYSIDGKFITYDQTIFSKLNFISDEENVGCVIHNDFTNNKTIPDNISNLMITGYNQNIGLFNEVMNSIPKYLSFDNTNIKNYIYDKYGDITNGTALCVRIGLDFEHMNKIKPRSYVNALEYLQNSQSVDNKVFIISDIPTDNYFNFDNNFVAVNECDIVQFYFGLLCQNYILSESTFHLWFAYLGSDFGMNDKKVIYFNDTDTTLYNRALENWIGIDY
jgi:hypothetical protein